jgi:hypothetical protein
MCEGLSQIFDFVTNADVWSPANSELHDIEGILQFLDAASAEPAAGKGPTPQPCAVKPEQASLPRKLSCQMVNRNSFRDDMAEPSESYQELPVCIGDIENIDVDDRSRSSGSSRGCVVDLDNMSDRSVEDELPLPVLQRQTFGQPIVTHPKLQRMTSVVADALKQWFFDKAQALLQGLIARREQIPAEAFANVGSLLSKDDKFASLGFLVLQQGLHFSQVSRTTDTAGYVLLLQEMSMYLQREGCHNQASSLHAAACNVHELAGKAPALDSALVQNDVGLTADSAKAEGSPPLSSDGLVPKGSRGAQIALRHIEDNSAAVISDEASFKKVPCNQFEVFPRLLAAVDALPREQLAHRGVPIEDFPVQPASSKVHNINIVPPRMQAEKPLVTSDDSVCRAFLPSVAGRPLPGAALSQKSRKSDTANSGLLDSLHTWSTNFAASLRVGYDFATMNGCTCEEHAADSSQVFADPEYAFEFVEMNARNPAAGELFEATSL